MAYRPRLARVCRACALGTLLLSAVSCHPAPTLRQRLDSPAPLDRAEAAVRLAELGDPTAVHKLVDLLEDRDPGVRMYAILALRHLCATDYGYKFYEPESDRAAAVQRWRAALQAGEVVVHRPANTGQATAPGDGVPER